MRRLGDMADRRPALTAGSLGGEALAAFVHESDCRALAVVDNGRPLGVLAREPFLARMELRGAEGQPVAAFLEGAPLVGEADEPPSEFVRTWLGSRAAALLGGFIVTRDGAYEGVCDLARLMPALTSAAAPLAGLVCGELREPLAHIRAAADGLSRLRLPQAAAAHLGTVIDAVRSARELIEAAAALERAEAGRLEISASPTRLHELLDGLEARWRARAASAGVTLLVSYDGPPEKAALVDGGRLASILDTLVGVAIARSARGVVEASLHVRGGESEVLLSGRVRDDGAGWTPEAIDGLFRKTGAGDAGLARIKLLAAAEAMAAMGGRIRAVGNRGPGATISFELAAPLAQPDLADGPRPDPEVGARPAHVLVVDDNATNRMVVEALCEMFGCSTESVSDGLAAVEAVRTGRFDIVLMDIKMPRMDGVTAARQIRQLPAPAGAVPIIALTANADSDDVARYIGAGMLTVVEKPIKPEVLMAAVERALDAAQSPQNAAAA